MQDVVAPRFIECPAVMAHIAVSQDIVSYGGAVDSTAGMPDDSPVELENQVILRLPPDTPTAFSGVLRSGASNVKNRLVI